MRTRDAAWILKCLPSMYEAIGLILSNTQTRCVCMRAYNSITEETGLPTSLRPALSIQVSPQPDQELFQKTKPIREIMKTILFVVNALR